MTNRSICHLSSRISCCFVFKTWNRLPYCLLNIHSHYVAMFLFYSSEFLVHFQYQRFTQHTIFTSVLLFLSIWQCKMAIDGVFLLAVLVTLHGCYVSGADECPPWHFTPENATVSCSQCNWFHYSAASCNERTSLIDIATFVTASNNSYPLYVGKPLFKMNFSAGTIEGSVSFRELPDTLSELEDYFCGSSNRQGKLCGECRAGCGVSIYTYYGLPCACPCHKYGIALFLLLEITFSTIFYMVLLLTNFSVNSSKWTTIIFYFQAIAFIIGNEEHGYAAFAMSGDWVPIALHTLYGVWNMDFLRLVIKPFCVSPNVSTLGAISTGYISAFWPLFLVLSTSMAVYLHKYNYKVVVYPWKVLNWMTMSYFQRQLNNINLIHTFATCILLSHTKLVYVCTSLLTIMKVSHQGSMGKAISTPTHYSFDPYVRYFELDHILYIFLALVIFTFVGMLLPLALIIYPTRCGTWLGNKCKWKRIRIAVRTFIEAFNGSYNDGSAGTKDYRAVPGVLLFLRSALVAFFLLRNVSIFHGEYSYLCGAFIFMTLASFFGLLKPYKVKIHNLYDVLILCLTAIQCLIFFMTLSVYKVGATLFHVLTALTFSCLFLFLFHIVKPLIVKLMLTNATHF